MVTVHKTSTVLNIAEAVAYQIFHERPPNNFILTVIQSEKPLEYQTYEYSSHTKTLEDIGVRSDTCLRLELKV